MKKRMIVALCAAFYFLGTHALAENPKPLVASDFEFAFEGVVYSLGEPAAPLVHAIEARFGSMHVMAVDSCLFEGKDKEFESDEILLGTYPIGPKDADQLETILVAGGDHQTARGIRIGMHLQDVEAAYGNGYRRNYDEMMYIADGLPTQAALVFVINLDTSLVTSFYMMRNSG